MPARFRREVKAERGWPFFRQTGVAPKRYYGPLESGSTPGTGALAANVLRALPFLEARGGAIDELVLDITVGAAGSIRLGVYTTVSETNIYPSRLLLDTGNQTVVSAGVRIINVNLNLEPGLYWIAYILDVAPTVRSIAAAGFLATVFGRPETLGAETPSAQWSVARAFGALPDPFPAGAAPVQAATLIPFIGVHYK